MINFKNTSPMGSDCNTAYSKLQKLKDQKEVACQEYEASEARYMRCIIDLFPQYNDEKFHLESHSGETFIVDRETGSEIYYLPNGFKL